MAQDLVWKTVTLQFDPALLKEGKDLRKDLSAIHLSEDGNLWLGCDEGASIERLTSSDRGQTFGKHQHFELKSLLSLQVSKKNPEKEIEIDIEGLAESDHYLWLVGSHSWKRKNYDPKESDAENFERLSTVKAEANRYMLARIPIVDGQLVKRNVDGTLTAAQLAIIDADKQGNLLMAALQDDPHLAAFIQAEIPSKDNGLDIEGLAVSHGRIFLGLRGPVLRGWAILLEVEVENTSPHLLKLKKIGQDDRHYKKYFLDLQGLGIREISIEGDDLLILAGPTMSLDGPVKIFRFVNGMHLGDNTFCKPQSFINIPYGEGVDHAEGMTQFQAIAGEPSLLLVYDSPAPQRLVGQNDIVADVFKKEWQVVKPQTSAD